jgi:hypothetical protein
LTPYHAPRAGRPGDAADASKEKHGTIFWVVTFLLPARAACEVMTLNFFREE